MGWPGLGRGDVTAEGYLVSSWGDEKAMELGGGGGCTTLRTSECRRTRHFALFLETGPHSAAQFGPKLRRNSCLGLPVAGTPGAPHRTQLELYAFKWFVLFYVNFTSTKNFFWCRDWNPGLHTPSSST